MSTTTACHKKIIERIPVFYTPKMVAIFDSFSPSPGKPAHVVAEWKRLGFPIEITPPLPATTEQFKATHDSNFVDQLFACEIKNGFHNKLPGVAATFPYTTGSLLCAAREAIRNQLVAVAPCSGFHHAGYQSPSGFCTFNGLMVTAMVLKAEGLVNRVGILDFDMHYGDGTDEIIKLFQVESWVEHFTAGKEYVFAHQANEFLSLIPDFIEPMRDCDVILYQAGADPHTDDPLGGLLTTEQLRLRDQIVFKVAKAMGVPIAWNLAGGYQVDSGGGIQPILDIHNNTMRECLTVYL